jgi:hypothetical protein
MKLSKLNITVIVAAAIIIFLLYQWKCNAPKAPPDSKKEIDSLQKVIQKVQYASTDKLNALAKDNDSLVDQNIIIQMRVSDITGELDASKKKIKQLQILVASPDTIGLIDPACADLSNEFDKYITLSDAKEKGLDSVIQNQQAIITNKDSALAEKENVNLQVNRSFLIAAKNYDDLYRSYNKKEKEIKWQKTKTKALVAVIVLGAAKIIMDATKK